MYYEGKENLDEEYLAPQVFIKKNILDHLVSSIAIKILIKIYSLLTLIMTEI